MGNWTRSPPRLGSCFSSRVRRDLASWIAGSFHFYATSTRSCGYLFGNRAEVGNFDVTYYRRMRNAGSLLRMVRCTDAGRRGPEIPPSESKGLEEACS